MNSDTAVVQFPRSTRGPRAPSTLGPIGRQEWKRVAPILAAQGKLPEDRKALLVAYCEFVEGSHECAAILKNQGRMVSRRGHPPRTHPAVRQHLAYMQQALRLAERLGIVAGVVSKDRKVNGRPSAKLDY